MMMVIAIAAITAGIRCFDTPSKVSGTCSRVSHPGGCIGAGEGGSMLLMGERVTYRTATATAYPSKLTTSAVVASSHPRP